MWGESHWVLAKSFVFHYMICILAKQVRTVLSLHFHCSWDCSAQSEKEAFVLPSVPACSLPGSLSRSLTPTGRNFLPSLISTTAHAWLWFMCLVTCLRGAELEFLSGKLFNNLQDKRRIFSGLFSSFKRESALASCHDHREKKKLPVCPVPDIVPDASHDLPCNYHGHPTG